jgi:hypothetical protein
MAPTVAATARTNPAVRGPGDSNSTAILTWYAAIGKDAAASAKALDGYAVNIQKGILKSSTVPSWVNKRLAARRQRMLLLRAARAFEAASKCARAAEAAWRGDFGEPGSVDKVRSGINFSK